MSLWADIPVGSAPELSSRGADTQVLGVSGKRCLVPVCCWGCSPRRDGSAWSTAAHLGCHQGRGLEKGLGTPGAQTSLQRWGAAGWGLLPERLGEGAAGALLSQPPGQGRGAGRDLGRERQTQQLSVPEPRTRDKAGLSPRRAVPLPGCQGWLQPGHRCSEKGQRDGNPLLWGPG